MKIMCFRFDVDTYLCGLKGVPNLVTLAKKNDVNFTFFYNMGRGIHIRSILKKGEKQACADKLSNLNKLGWRGYIVTTLLNPQVGISYPEEIVSAHRNGNEIGLHGGRNHGDWMKNASSWSINKIEREVEWGLSKLNNIGINNVTSFSSPGWNSPTELNDILMRKGFTVVADRHGLGMEEIVKIRNNGNTLNLVPTNLLGEPGGVGYIEHMRARRMGNDKIMEKFRNDLKSANKLVVVYDHPYYSGIKELTLLEMMIHEAQSMGFHITTFNKLAGLS